MGDLRHFILVWLTCLLSHYSHICLGEAQTLHLIWHCCLLLMEETDSLGCFCHFVTSGTPVKNTALKFLESLRAALFLFSLFTQIHTMKSLRCFEQETGTCIMLETQKRDLCYIALIPWGLHCLNNNRSIKEAQTTNQTKQKWEIALQVFSQVECSQVFSHKEKQRILQRSYLESWGQSDSGSQTPTELFHPSIRASVE